VGVRTIERTKAVAEYIVATGTRENDVQRRLRAATKPLPGAGMQIGPDQGQFLGFLAKAIGARNAIEVGTFTGYSALAVALALPPDGKLIACDISKERTDVGRPFWHDAGVADRIDLRLGPALDTLAALVKDGRAGTFDFAFVDADKGNYDRYYEACLTLLRPGGIIALDNMLWSGAVADPSETDAETIVLRNLNAKIQSDKRVDMCLLAIGDGVNLARKR
jgi:O-methyltransferase